MKKKTSSINHFRHFLFLKDTVDFDSDGILRLRHRDPDTDEERKYVASLGREVFSGHGITCIKGHTLAYVDMRTISFFYSGYWRGYTCDVCRRSYRIKLNSHYCLHCPLCSYDLCMACAKKKLSKVANIIAYPYEISGVPPKY